MEETPTNLSEMTLDKFNCHFIVRITKYMTTDVGTVVGHTLTCNCNASSRYFEATVPLTSTDVIADAWTAIKADVKPWAATIVDVPSKPLFAAPKI